MATDTGAMLLKAILAFPDDDTPRLVYADWLDENPGAVPCGACEGKGGRYGDPGMDAANGTRCRTCSGTGRVPDGRAARAEFIRVQVAIPGAEADVVNAHPRKMPALQDRLNDLRRRERELRRDNADRWLVGVPGLAVHKYADAGRRGEWGWVAPGGSLIRPEFRRGFVDALTVSSEDWLRHEAALYWHPDQTVPCPRCEGRADDGGDVNDRGMVGWCMRCWDAKGQKSTGTVPRPFVPTAHPVREVRLTAPPRTTIAFSPVVWGKCDINWRDGTMTSDKWEGLVFHLPAES